MTLYQYRGRKINIDRGCIAFCQRQAKLFGVQPFVWLRPSELPHHIRVWTASVIRRAIRNC